MEQDGPDPASLRRDSYGGLFLLALDPVSYKAEHAAPFPSKDVVEMAQKTGHLLSAGPATNGMGTGFESTAASKSLAAAGDTVGRFQVVHATRKRIRMKSSLFTAPTFDSVYFQAFIEALPGVNEARVNIAGQSLVIVFDGSAQTWQRICGCLQSPPPEVFQLHQDTEIPVGFSTVATKAALTAAGLVFRPPLQAGLGWVVSVNVLAKGVEALINRGIKVEVLDALAVGLSLLRRNYFTAGAISTMLALGQYLEEHSEQRSIALLKGLLRPQSEHVWLVRDGVETRVTVAEVRQGDLAVCGAGELIPIDGTVVDGDASVNQSSISGEAVPIHIKPGDQVISGSVIEEGRLSIRVERAGSETSMARITKYIDQSLRYKSKRQTKSSELADKLVPITLGLSGLTYITTRDASRAASILTVDFSCAVKLASPIAVRSGMHAAGHAGVLLKGATALDALLDVDTLVFDKTGTLTTGQLTVTDIVALEGYSEQELLCLAAGAEEHYDHPVARAVVRETKARSLALPPAGRVDFIVAHGVSAFIDEANILVGSHHFIAEDEGVDCDAIEQKAHELRGQGKSLLYVAREGVLIGVIALRDDPRPEAAEVLAALKEQGFKHIVVLTGDHKETAQALGSHLPQIDEIHYELKPDDKAGIVSRLKETGHTVAYVGDGVNDAPALVNAHVGICMPKGADLAKESAQVLLLEENLHGLAIARKTANRTNTVIKNCFAATIGCNTLTMLLAAAGLPPVGAALLHNASTVSILSYAAMAASRPFPPSGEKSPWQPVPN